MVWTGHSVFYFNGTFNSRLKKIQEYQFLNTIVISLISISWNRSVQLLEELLIFSFPLLQCCQGEHKLLLSDLTT